MLIKTRMVLPDAKKEKQIEVEALINISHVSLVLPTALKGQIVVVMQDGKKHTVIAEYDSFIGRV